jgi:hypothetical protein
MVSDQDFSELKQQVAGMNELLGRLARSHKDLLEKLLPEVMEKLNKHIVYIGESHTDLMNKTSALMEQIGMLADSVNTRLDILENLGIE